MITMTTITTFTYNRTITYLVNCFFLNYVSKRHMGKTDPIKKGAELLAKPPVSGTGNDIVKDNPGAGVLSPQDLKDLWLPKADPTEPETIPWMGESDAKIPASGHSVNDQVNEQKYVTNKAVDQSKEHLAYGQTQSTKPKQKTDTDASNTDKQTMNEEQNNPTVATTTRESPALVGIMGSGPISQPSLQVDNDKVSTNPTVIWKAPQGLLAGIAPGVNSTLYNKESSVTKEELPKEIVDDNDPRSTQPTEPQSMLSQTELNQPSSPIQSANTPEINSTFSSTSDQGNSSYSIPTPPPLPPMLPPKPKKSEPDPNAKAFTEELKDLANEQGNPDGNLKPSVILKQHDHNLKPSYVNPDKSEQKRIYDALSELIEDSKKPEYIFTSQIKETTNIEDISIERLFFEAYQRGIIKLNNQTPVSFVTEDGSKITVGEYPYNIKASPLGIALLDQTKKNAIIEKNYSASPSDSDNQEEDTQRIIEQLVLITIPTQGIATVIPSENQTHIVIASQYKKELAVYNKESHTYKLYAHMTSQTGFTPISKTQFKLYQKQKSFEEQNQTYVASSDEGHQDKKIQYLKVYDNIKEIPADQVVVLKWGSTYIQDCVELENVKDRIEALNKKPIEQLKSRGITDQDLLQSCQQFDTNKAKKIPQPQTEMQLEKKLKTDEIHKEKHKEKLEQTKLEGKKKKEEHEKNKLLALQKNNDSE